MMGAESTLAHPQLSKHIPYLLSKATTLGALFSSSGCAPWTPPSGATTQATQLLLRPTTVSARLDLRCRPSWPSVPRATTPCRVQ